ncbi:MAG: hypothetical protein R2724_21055 [Bryobacterales bacterium]
MLGLLREEKCFAAEILHERGLRLSPFAKSSPARSRKAALEPAQRKLSARRVQPRPHAGGARQQPRSAHRPRRPSSSALSRSSAAARKTTLF